MSQETVLRSGPAQGFPVPLGGGSVHVRVSSIRPPPQLTEQDDGVGTQSLHPPSTDVVMWCDVVRCDVM